MLLHILIKLIYLTACQLIQGYFMSRYSLYVHIYLREDVSLESSFLPMVMWYQEFQSNTNNLYSVVLRQVIIIIINNNNP